MSEEILSVAQCQQADNYAIIQGVAETELMAHAGLAVARVVQREYPRRPFCVLVGPGNNGGDAIVCALELLQAGCKVQLVAMQPLEEMTGSSRYFAKKWAHQVHSIADATLADQEIVIDGLFGAGINREVPTQVRDFFSRIDNPVVAIDLPSGVNGDTGKVHGYSPVCEHTVSFFRIKAGHLLLPGRKKCGTTHICDIGIPQVCLDDIQPKWRCNEKPDFRSLVASPDDNKFSRGCVGIIASEQMRGATQLATRATQRTGAGMVYVFAPVHAVSHYQLALASAPVIAVQSPRELLLALADKRIKSLVVGPGLVEIEDDPGLLRELAQLGKPMVLDAAAITALAHDTDIVATSNTPLVITPHAGEFARLFPDIDVANLPQAVTTASARLGCTVVYKGYTTLIAAPQGEIIFSINAQSDLATSGSGDVLAGMIGSLLAKGLSPFDAAASACWWHSEAGKGFGLIAEDIIEAIPNVARYHLKTSS